MTYIELGTFNTTRPFRKIQNNSIFNKYKPNMECNKYIQDVQSLSVAKFYYFTLPYQFWLQPVKYLPTKKSLIFD